MDPTSGAQTPNPIFYPLRRRGLAFQGALFVLLGGIAGAALWSTMELSLGVNFVILLLLALALFIPLPLLGYRFYALLSARYIVEREGLRLRWGLRGEDIPLADIQWVRQASDLPFELPGPRLNWPGALVGTRRVRELGIVEFMASGRKNLTLVASPTRVFAISPADAKGFIRAVQTANELGSLHPITPFSTRPAMFLRRIWQDRLSRWLILAGLVLNLALFVLVSLLIPTRTGFSIGFNPAGQPLPPGPPQMLLLLPILSGFTFLIDLFLGLFIFRAPEQRPAARLVFAAMILPPLLLIIALSFIR